MSDAIWMTAADLVAAPAMRGLGPSGAPIHPVAVVDLASLGAAPAAEIVRQLAAAAAASDAVLVARCALDQIEVVRPVAAECALTMIRGNAADDLPPEYVAVPDPDIAVKELIGAVTASPQAAVVLADLLRTSAGLDVRSALFAESAAYSMLLAGTEFADWRSSRERRADDGPDKPPVIVARDGDDLFVTLNRPERHNAFGRWVRDATCDALDLAVLDPSISRVRMTGAGHSFCSGGDLDEFGTQPDVVLAHLIRLERSVGWRLHRLADRMVVELHGACVGAGMELPAFAGRVSARDGTWFALPELAMGLIPGAGGTVSLPRRIGRWRTAWLALTGVRLDLDTALAWGLVDHVAD